jgi:hypothetical protein
MNYYNSIILVQPYENDPQSILPCTFIWDSIYGSIELRDPEQLDEPLLPIDVAVAYMVPNHESSSAKWIISQIPTPISIGNRFWFHFDQPFQEHGSSSLLLGELSTIHQFIGNYTLVEISPILHFDLDHGWIAGDGEIFWMNTGDLILDLQERHDAQRAFFQNPTFTPLHASTDEE